MKRRIVLITSVILLLTVSLSLFLGCNKEEGEKQIPVYKEMIISTANVSSAASFNTDAAASSEGNEGENVPGSVEGDFVGRNDIIDQKDPFGGNRENKTVEQEMKSAVEPTLTPDAIYYARSNRDIYVRLLIDNPDGCEIVSVAFNGKTYSSDMFEAGSDLESITLKYEVGSASGIVEYTLDGIKYRDGDEEKDVILEGSRTAKVGLRKADQVTAAVSDIDIGSNALSCNVSVTDSDGLIAFFGGAVRAVLYDGTEIVAQKELSLGKNAVVFDGLATGSLYQCAVVGYFDDLSGDGFGMKVLYKRAFYTDTVVLFEDVAVGRESIGFGLLWNDGHQSKTLSALKLYQGEALVRELLPSATVVDGLFCNNTYRLVAEYQNGDATESIAIVFTTFAKATPTISITDPKSTQSSVSFTVNEFDIDNIGAVVKIELLHANGTIYSKNLAQRTFTGLLSNNVYTVKITYVYNLNDGAGSYTVTRELTIATAPKATPEIAITDPTKSQTSIGFAISESDMDNVGALTRIELIHEGGTVVAQSLDQRAFSGLLANSVYTLRITYVYDLNDGTGQHTLTRELVFITREEQRIDLSEYTVVTGAELTEYGQQYALDVAQGLSALTGLDISVKRDTVGDAIQNQAFEVLIGLTRREESIRAYNEIAGDGWTVRIFDRKVVIVGTTPYLTMVALNWFERTCLDDEHIDGVILTLSDEIVMPNMTVLPLSDGTTTFTVVYETGKDPADAPYQIANKVYADLLEKTGLMPSFLTANNSSALKEILVGNMSRSNVKAELLMLEADEYAITVRQGKIYLVAWSDDVLPSAYALFKEMLLASAVTDANGNVTYKIPSGCTLIREYESDWITDFPKPEFAGLYPEAAVNANDGSLQYIYAGPGATREAFVAYCNALVEAGYTPLGEGDVHREGSSFCTFINNEKGVSLHVSHMAFTHAATQGVEGLVNSIRIVSGPLASGGNLVDESHFRPQVEGSDYIRRTRSQITSNIIDYTAADNWGFGQVITLADGSFILIDGGRNYGGAGEVTNLWNVLREMHKKAYGSYPTKTNPVHIRAWIITHEHGDHHNLIQNFIKKYGANEALRFDYLLANFGSATQLRTAAGTYSLRNNMKTYQQTVKNGFELVQVNTGQVFYFANCKLEILHTVDDMYPWRCSEQNNASLIVRTTLYESDGTNSHETTSLWLGDAEIQASAVARAMWGSFLASDQVQISHHGNNGGSDQRLYEMVGNCEVIWYPNVVSQSALDRALKNNWACNFSAAFKNPNCKLMIFNGSNVSGCPAWNVTLTITPTGALYDQLYDAVTGEHITAKGSLWPAVDVQAYRKAVGK